LCCRAALVSQHLGLERELLELSVIHVAGTKGKVRRAPTWYHSTMWSIA
jgi:hypothetical protein